MVTSSPRFEPSSVEIQDNLNSSCATVTTPWYYARPSDRGRVPSFRPRPFTHASGGLLLQSAWRFSNCCCFYLNDPIDPSFAWEDGVSWFLLPIRNVVKNWISSLHALLLGFWAPFLFADVVAPEPLHAAFSESAVCRSVRKSYARGVGSSSWLWKQDRLNTLSTYVWEVEVHAKPCPVIRVWWGSVAKGPCGGRSQKMQCKYANITYFWGYSMNSIHIYIWSFV